MVTPMTQRRHKHNNEAVFHSLLIGAQQGDKKLYTTLLRHIADIARQYVKRKLGDHADAEDVVQEILMSVHKALHTYDPSRAAMPWIAAIMYYRLNDWLRNRYHISEQIKIALAEVENYLADDVTEFPFAYEYLHKAIKELSETQQSVIHAMYQQQLTVSETSEALGMSVSAVKVTAHRAYKKLRKKLEEK